MPEPAKEPVTPVVKLDKNKFIKRKLGETDEPAEKFEADTKVKIAKMDSTEAQGVCQENKACQHSLTSGDGTYSLLTLMITLFITGNFTGSEERTLT